MCRLSGATSSRIALKGRPICWWRSSAKPTPRDRVHKLALHAQHGVPEYWIVDPDERVIEFLLLDGDCYKVEPLASNQYASPRLPEVSIDLPVFWADVDRLING